MASQYIQEFDRIAQLRSYPRRHGYGIVNGGIYANVGGTVRTIAGERSGTDWFVDANTGSNTDSGRSWAEAFSTMAKAFTVVGSGDRIFLRGKIQEQLDTPDDVFDVSIFGVSPGLRHPDSTPTNGNLIPARWATPDSPTAATPLLNIRQQGWYICNLLFTGDSSNDVDSINVLTDTGSGNDEHSASHAQIVGCKFQGGRYGVAAVGGNARIWITDSEFLLFSNSGDTAIKTAGGGGGGKNWGWRVERCDFSDNLNDIVGAFYNGRFLGNFHHFNGAQGTTNVVAYDTSAGAENLIAKNYFFCASNESGINARVVPSATDIMGPNYYSDQEEYGEPSE